MADGMPELIKALLIEDNPGDTFLIQEMLCNVGDALCELECADRLSTGLERLTGEDIDVVLVDLLLPDSHGIDTFFRVRARAPQVPAVVLSNLNDKGLAIKAVREGAQDYLVKGQVDGEMLVHAMRYAVERKRAEEALRRRNRELALLNRASRAFSSTLDLDQVLVNVLEEVRRLLGVVASSVWLVEPETDELVCLQVAGPQSEIVRGWRLRPGEGLAGWVAHSGETLFVSDIRSDERHSERVDRETGLALRSVLSVPLRVKQGVIGVLQVVDTEVGRFDEMDLELVEPLAASAAIAIENARLYEETDRLRAFNENIVQSLEEGILLESVSGQFTFVNPKAAALLGYAPEELVGRRWADILPPEYEASIEEGGWQSHRGTLRYEIVLLTKQGRQVPVIVSARLLYEEGCLAGVLSVFTDITARKRAEEELRRTAEELARSNAELEQFARVASHDLQEPLRTVTSQLQLLKRLYEDKLGPDTDELIASALDGVDRMCKLVSDLLTYSRAGKEGGPLEPADCGAVLDRTLANLQFAIEESDAAVTHGPLPTVMVDATRLGQLFQNLVSNAIKFRGAEPPHVHIAAEQKEGEWVFSVSDNGIGIFQRSHSEMGPSSTGLGLAICKKIVERHGGRVWVESRPEKGSTFYFTIPARDDATTDPRNAT